ncbi:MAG: hypothetical protein KKE02_23260 [Alphaproteobacteria bacterium]|nr:hypothetical protein [Alphaproteobacteria bacterium]MBU1517102.1 hypothetical protein [Alphaproteobacteria bacterium]MBU2093721.1 hypothetical protein [Alphaproteobacteria bacterium]MBU2153957.1 hypothetical protein [Alphaproteobacteria bacterium]MBU2308679.1 hypothetical protein [Alphaproteobacteria bacterium]
MNKALAATAALLASMGLAACQPQAPDGAPAPPPADAPAITAAPSSSMDISKPITARGTEPFWALTIDGKAFKLTRPEHPDVIAEAPGAAIASGRAIWVAKTPEGQQITVTLYASACSDGMSDSKYPLTAEVVMLNESLRGCAAKTAELPREAPPK